VRRKPVRHFFPVYSKFNFDQTEIDYRSHKRANVFNLSHRVYKINLTTQSYVHPTILTVMIQGALYQS
jgi:hypothetical protein